MDTLASEYGWTKDYILESVYPEEAFSLMKVINTRIKNQYLTQLAIAHNPWSKEPKQLWKTFGGEADYSSQDADIEHAKVKELKSMLSNAKY